MKTQSEMSHRPGAPVDDSFLEEQERRVPERQLERPADADAFEELLEHPKSGPAPSGLEDQLGDGPDLVLLACQQADAELLPQTGATPLFAPGCQPPITAQSTPSSMAPTQTGQLAVLPQGSSAQPQSPGKPASGRAEGLYDASASQTSAGSMFGPLAHQTEVQAGSGDARAAASAAAETSQLASVSTEAGADSGSSQQDQPPEAVAVSTLGDSILKGILQQGTSGAASGGPNGHGLAEIVERVAELVQASDASTKSSDTPVRLVFKESVLPGTEVLVSRDGASLSVRFVTRSEDASLFLTVNQRALQEQLSENLNRPVSVEVSTDQQDGRSRDQRDAYSELDEED